MKKKILLLFTACSFLIGCALTLNAAPSKVDAQKAWEKLNLYQAQSSDILALAKFKDEASRKPYADTQEASQTALEKSEKSLKAMKNYDEQSWPIISTWAIPADKALSIITGEEALTDISDQERLILEYAGTPILRNK